MVFELARPIYQQIIEEYKKMMIRGELRQGDKILSQREYAEKARTNPNTVQRAYREMENMKLVETVRGQGTFVCIDPVQLERIRSETAASVIELCVAEMKALGFSDREIRERLEQVLDSAKEAETDDRI
ncbi:MAG: GntR family transcriptional regulator [Deltaproteobacteria bacterium]